METEVLHITDENKKDTMKLVAGRKILKSVCGPAGTFLTVSNEPVEEVEDLEIKSREELDKIAEDLGLNPDDYSNKAKLIKAIEKAK